MGCRRTNNRPFHNFGVGLWQRGSPTLRRVRLAVVGAVQRQGELGLGYGSRVNRRLVGHPRSAQIQRYTGNNHARQAVQERDQGVAPLAVGVDSHVRAALQNTTDKARQDRARPHFYEGTNACRVHGLDLVHETHRLGNRATELAGNVVSVGFRGGVSQDRKRWLLQVLLIQERFERVSRRCHDRRMERCGDRQSLEGNASRFECRLRQLNASRRSRQNHLGRAVVVGDNNVDATNSGTNRINVCLSRGHGAVGLSGIAHELTTTPSNPQRGLLIKSTRSRKRSDLAKAVTGHHGCGQSNLTQHGQQGQGCRTNGGLRPLGRGQECCLRGRRVAAEDRHWEGHFSELHVSHLNVLGAVPDSPSTVHMHGQSSAHIHVLAALAGEYEPNFAHSITMSNVHAIRRAQRLVG